MKFNVDLTQDRIFSSDGEIENYSINEFVLTGSAEIRKRKKDLYQIDMGHICDCCGADLTLKPWAKHYCLCGKCADLLNMKKFGGVIWQQN